MLDCAIFTMLIGNEVNGQEPNHEQTRTRGNPIYQKTSLSIIATIKDFVNDFSQSTFILV